MRRVIRADRNRGRTSDGHAPAGTVAVALSELARDMEAETSLIETLQAITSAATVNIPGAGYAGITLVRSQVSTTPAASGRLVRIVEAVQAGADQGPCLSSIREERTVRSDDLRIDPRWPLFTAAAVAAGVRSMLAFLLFVQDQDLGALNVYSTEVGAFDGEAENVGLLLATHAAIALDAAQREQNLRAAISSRDLIGQATGILMERHKITTAAAFNELLRRSSHANRKLSSIALEVVESVAAPTNPDPSEM